MPEKLVEVKDLEISFGEGSKKFVAVKNANFFINSVFTCRRIWFW